MIEVIEKQPVPIYEVECYECKSKLHYKGSDVYWCHITCPVCGTSLWANTIRPIKMEETDIMDKPEKTNQEAMCELSPEEFYEKLKWLFIEYGPGWTDTKYGVVKWLQEPAKK